ncbi:MAG: hypothetical protein C0483_05075 [Pirellula sp.]|nr:hypothetical protein [Pirellula sp.]
MRSPFIAFILAVSCGGLFDSSTAAAGERYFVTIFGSESSPKRARYTHTWATVTRATTDDANPAAPPVLESLTISWMPRNLTIRPLALRPECGVNLSLEATIRDCRCKGECIAMWGPFDYDPCIGPTLFEKVRRQVARLESGCVLYKCIDPDTGPRSTYISDCIHAVTDLDPYLPRPSYNELTNYGMDASRHLVSIMASRNRFDPQDRHEWVAQALGIDAGVQRRTPHIAVEPANVATE